VISKDRNNARSTERKKRERGGKERRKKEIIHCDCQAWSETFMALSLRTGHILREGPTLREINS
jgi:helix-turn-helix protein